MEDFIEETIVEEVEETEAAPLPIEQESPANSVADPEVPVKTRGAISYTFTCSKCGRVVCINSDLYPTVEQKKSQHSCQINGLPASKLKEK